ncbi:delta-class carbonic anhydrase [Roseibium suaedae]|uniref:Cadmium carbonic anhydrase repeat-containing protein n=1 Tax=Roseibium suaedae TaxID=735517 RepID=A0A1M7GS86_9HYPH|nr:delta-class carbonic anhydrase [Roseibium suaedae]SHM18729.1 Cadmium carbonic anhydrase repeat-containing protein [Roseibium suaedae]
MQVFIRTLLTAGSALALMGTSSFAEELCKGFGPQTPRDISMKDGTNHRVFNLAPEASSMNLCNIHTHTNAEHKGPGFSISAGTGEHGGFKCNETDSLTAAELAMPTGGHNEEAFHGVKPGDTIEVHWVYSSCDVQPGKGLGACLSNSCANPQLRVESQVFLVVNDPKAANFMDFAYMGNAVNGFQQPKSLPAGTGTPVVFAGSTTGPSYTEATCSPLQVTWSVHPQCAKLDINSLNAWAKEDKVFEEDHSHGVRQLVTAQELLAPIQ